MELRSGCGSNGCHLGHGENDGDETDGVNDCAPYEASSTSVNQALIHREYAKLPDGCSHRNEGESGHGPEMPN